MNRTNPKLALAGGYAAFLTIALATLAVVLLVITPPIDCTAPGKCTGVSMKPLLENSAASIMFLAILCLLVTLYATLRFFHERGIKAASVPIVIHGAALALLLVWTLVGESISFIGHPLALRLLLLLIAAAYLWESIVFIRSAVRGGANDWKLVGIIGTIAGVAMTIGAAIFSAALLFKVKGEMLEPAWMGWGGLLILLGILISGVALVFHGRALLRSR